MCTTDNNEKFTNSVRAKSGIEYTIAWESQHPSSLRITFRDDDSYFITECEDARDPNIRRIEKLLAKEDYYLTTDHSIRNSGAPIEYILRFKKQSGKDTKVAELLHVVNIIAARG